MTIGGIVVGAQGGLAGNGAGSTFTRRSVCWSLAASALLLGRRSFLPAAHAAPPHAKGSFQGHVVAEWLPGGREMRLTQAFEYTASDGMAWPVPAGAIVDGASIPKVFWSIIGGPFEGLYREPSVVHDYYCDVKTRPYLEVHSVFFEAMLTSGVDNSRAWLMYKAVTNFGPSWTDNTGQCGKPGPSHDFCARSLAPAPTVTPELDKEKLTAFARDIEGEIDPADLAALKEAINKVE